MATFNNRYKAYIDGAIYRLYTRLDVAEIIKQAHENKAKNISIKDLKTDTFIYQESK